LLEFAAWQETYGKYGEDHIAAVDLFLKERKI